MQPEKALSFVKFQTKSGGTSNPSAFLKYLFAMLGLNPPPQQQPPVQRASEPTEEEEEEEYGEFDEEYEEEGEYGADEPFVEDYV